MYMCDACYGDVVIVFLIIFYTTSMGFLVMHADALW